MLTSIMQSVYIDAEWIANEYTHRCKQNKWNKEDDMDALRCWNLERVIDAEIHNKPIPEKLTMDSISGETD